MPFFKYIARDRSGKSIEEVREAPSKEDIIRFLQSKDLFTVSIEKAPEAKPKKKAPQKRRFHRRVKPNDLIMFAVQLSTLLSAGVTLIKSLYILSKQVESRSLLTAIEAIIKDVEAGGTFHSALERHDKIFSPFWIHLVQTGEASGHLPLSLEQLAGYLEEAAALRKKIISAMVYPIILVCMALGAISVFLIKIIPIFSDIFKGFDVQLPLLTRIVITLSDFFRRYFLVITGGFAGAFFILKKYASTKMGMVHFDRFKLNLPVFGALLKEIAIERFASGLATLIKSGVPVLHALEIAEKTADNKIMQLSLRDVAASVKAGRSIAQTMEQDELFSPLVVQMIGVGEEIGELGKMLDRISMFYKERVDMFVTRLTTMFEPIALIVIGAIVGVLVIAMFLPIFSLSSAIR